MNANIDLEKLQKYALNTWLFKQGEMVSLVIHLGHRLGLYEAMDGAGMITAEELSGSTGCHERWILEWLRCNAAAGLIETSDGINFRLEPEGAAVLAQSDKPTYAAAVFANLKPIEVVDGIADAFKTGIGLSYDGQGDGSEHAVEAMCGPMSKALLLSQVVPQFDELESKLEKGARVLDVGCGTGLAIELLAEAFPKSVFIGYDPSTRAIDAAKKRFSTFDNVELFNLGAESIPESNDIDFAMTLDCLHDMPRPDIALKAIHGALNDSGTLLVKEIKSSATWNENLRNPVLALMYATSITTCLSSAMSDPDTLGLGTLGLNPDLLEELTREAGFTYFQQHKVEDPTNLYYEVRP
ncbi:MAG: class I SAM-dependent methyltransferase [Actinomycetota bacterium]|nr:class I SAM-dependent methyltransferase [Actinomycetota bacterium]